jgi:hypothetical protein
VAAIHLALDIDSEVYPELHAALTAIGSDASRAERLRQLAATGLVWERIRTGGDGLPGPGLLERPLPEKALPVAHAPTPVAHAPVPVAHAPVAVAVAHAPVRAAAPAPRCGAAAARRRLAAGIGRRGRPGRAAGRAACGAVAPRARPSAGRLCATAGRRTAGAAARAAAGADRTPRLDAYAPAAHARPGPVQERLTRRAPARRCAQAPQRGPVARRVVSKVAGPAQDHESSPCPGRCAQPGAGGGMRRVPRLHRFVQAHLESELRISSTASIGLNRSAPSRRDSPSA